MDTFKFQTRWEELMATVYLNISMAFDTESQIPILEKLSVMVWTSGPCGGWGADQTCQSVVGNVFSSK